MLSDIFTKDKIFIKLIKYAGFKETELEEMLDNELYCFSIWERRIERYILHSMNESSRKLFLIEDEEEKCITDYYKIDWLKCVKDIYVIENQDKIMTFIYREEENSNWAMHLVFIDNKIYVFSQKLMVLDSLIKYICYMEEKEMVSYDFQYEIQFVDENRYIICAYDSVFERLFQIKDYKSLSIQSKPKSIAHKENYVKALIHNQNLRTPNILEVNGIRVPIMQEIVLNVGGDPNRMIVMANIINKRQYEIIDNLYESKYRYIYNCYLNGVARIDFKENGNTFIYKNLIMQYFLDFDMNAEKKILNSKALSLAVEKGYRHFEYIEFKGKDNGVITCELSVIPVITSCNIVYLIIFLQQKYVKDREDIFRLVNTLTMREKEVLYYASCGKSNSWIADKLGICLGTVKRIIYNGYRKLNICSRMQLKEMKEYLKFVYYSHKKFT